MSITLKPDALKNEEFTNGLMTMMKHRGYTEATMKMLTKLHECVVKIGIETNTKVDELIMEYAEKEPVLEKAQDGTMKPKLTDKGAEVMKVKVKNVNNVPTIDFGTEEKKNEYLSKVNNIMDIEHVIEIEPIKMAIAVSAGLNALELDALTPILAE